MGISKFTRNGLIGPTYYCKLCKKRTRETGHDESSCELCKSCYFECLKENEEMNK
jgi:NAD-dependent dihydropyrimidine dehydrogenase PreA subunit